MATSLDSYLRGQYKDDRAFLRRLTNTIDEVIPIFYERSAKVRIAEGAKALVTSWPYAAVSGKSQPGKGDWVSASTHCMILFALDAFGTRKKDEYSILLGKGFRPPPLSSENEKRLKPVIAAAKEALVQVVNRSRGAPLVRSGTYGDDDPFTLTWLTEIVFRWIDCDNVPDKSLAKCQAKIVAAAARVLKKQSILRTAKTGFSEVTGSFLRVRRLHLARAARRLTGRRGNSVAKNWIDENTPRLWKDFEDTIHHHLSYSSMGEQKFDPAELAFALEGALLLHPNWIGRSTVDEVFEALKLSRDRHPFWRPVTPFLANDRGHILFLISIEVANSILRACEILQDREGSPQRFSQFEPHLRTYATWLLGEMEEISEAGKPNLLGWRTEYEDEHDTIQLWHTSHVLVFLAHYAAFLKRKIAAGGLDAAGLQTRTPKLLKDYWKSEPLTSVATRTKKEQPYAVLRKIRAHYIDPLEEHGKNSRTPRSERKKDGNPKAAPLYSMLLYGPPGTGKTTVAEQIAAQLKRPLLIITVSDFLAAGAAEIENRAKGVFEVLRAQQDVVILFDEIDQFLLDRNSELYDKQDDIFKFMTPGMLTKLQDLREAQNSIFVVATNYYERIDSAIKRTGRIDEHFLLCLPDQQQRLNLLKGFVKKILSDIPSDRIKAKLRAAKVAEKTVLFGWGDLKRLTQSKLIDKKKMRLKFAEALALAIADKEVQSAVNLGGYHSRFKEGGPLPFEEFFLLVYLLAEGKSGLSSEDKTAIRRVLDCLFKENKDKNFREVLQNVGIKEKVICATIAKYLKDLIKKHKKDLQEIADHEKTPKK